MKLYRGLKSNEYKEFNDEVLKKYFEGWSKIVSLREKGNLNYPEELDELIKKLFQHQYLVRQYFTDNKKLAETYAKKEKGMLLEIEVPKDELLKNFILELQNYQKRKERFEVTYIVTGLTLFKNAKKWKLNIRKL